MKKTSLFTYLLIFTAIAIGLYAADAASLNSLKPALDRVEAAVDKTVAERDALRAENTELKAKVSQLALTVAQLQAAAVKLQEQRDAALNGAVQAAIAAATPQEKKP